MAAIYFLLPMKGPRVRPETTVLSENNKNRQLGTTERYDKLKHAPPVCNCGNNIAVVSPVHLKVSRILT